MVISSGLFAVVALIVQWGAYGLISSLKVYQVVYELGPDSHAVKSKTPSFGGIAIVLNMWLACAMFKWYSPVYLWLLMVLTAFAILGFLDDYVSVSKGRNQGLTSAQKFCLQVVVAIGLLWLCHLYVMPIAIWQWVFYGFIMVGASNATNLSDGLDGLLGGLSILSVLGFSFLFHRLGHFELLEFCVAFGGVLVVFLTINRYPARQFMGDTGSLAIGGVLAGLSILYGDVWVLVPLGAVYILETLSVMVQVGWYKRTQTRVFLMAPLHHHFELMGLSEIWVVRLFWALQVGFIVVYFILKGIL
jgi:phospho-N-acetylmuramoyl-pentapeptide-transferase